MIPLATPSLPTSPSLLEDAVRAGFARYSITARSVQAQGQTTSALDNLRIDLSGAEVTRNLRVEKPGVAGAETITASRLAIDAKPLLLEGAALEFHLEADAVVFALSEAGAGQQVLSPIRAENGRLSVEATRPALEELLRKAATEVASKHGVEIREVHLKLVSTGSRTLTFEAEVIAKVFIMKAPVTLRGHAEINDALDLRLSELTVGGNNMAANIANSFARPHLERLQSQPISLAVLSMGEIKLHDVEIAGGDSLRIGARFRS